MKTRKLGKLSIILTALVIGLGYAAVTTTLSVTGTTTVGSSTFNVVFDSSSLTGTNITDKAVSDDGSTLTFQTGKLKDIGDTASISYKISNDTQYGATISSVTCEPANESKDLYAYLTIQTPGEITIAKGETSSTQTINVRLSKSYAEENDEVITFTCKMTATASAA